MTRIIAFLFAILALGAVLAWLADRPGDVSIVWQGYRIEMSAMALFLGLIVASAALALLWQLYRAVMGAPGSIADFFRGRRRMKGYQALSQGMIAVGAGDARFANLQAKHARKLLEGEPLVGLLTAQAAQLSGDPDSARAAFEDMLDTPETALLGLHGLFVEAERQGQIVAARRCVAEAVKRAPALAWAAEADFQFKIRDGAWDLALSALDRNEQNRLVSKTDAKRKRAVLLTAKAMELEDTEPERALETASEAHKLAPEFVPAAMVAGRSAGGLDRLSQASAIIEKTWKAAPHPDLADIYAHLRSGDTTQDRFKRVKALTRKKPGHIESRVALARAAVEASDWSAGREALEPLLAREPSRRVCVMMAQIEDGEHGDRGRVREWLARAVRAPRDPAWVADGQISDDWAPVSPVSHTLDGYEWAVPLDDGGAISADVLEALGAAEPDAPMIEVQQSPEKTAEVTPLSSEPIGSTRSTKQVNDASDIDSTETDATAKQQSEAAPEAKNKEPRDVVDQSAAPELDETTDQPPEVQDDTPPSGQQPMSKGMKRAMDSGAIAPAAVDGDAESAETAVKPPAKMKPGAEAPKDKLRPKRGTGSNGETISSNGRRSGPEAVAGVAVAAQRPPDDIEARLLPSQPDDPGPLAEGDDNDADKKKWMGLFN
ncbi:MAG: heme biosynthesis HemY N-terminal domain-containing protein [Pseudomonadota bacterium]